jgi:hypothetical protein
MGKPNGGHQILWSFSTVQRCRISCQQISPLDGLIIIALGAIAARAPSCSKRVHASSTFPKSPDIVKGLSTIHYSSRRK